MTTEIITNKLIIAWTAVPITFAVADPTDKSWIVESLKLIIPCITALGLGWIGFKQNTHIKKQDALTVTVEKLEKNTNGMNDKLNKAVAGESLAIGRAEGIVEAEAKAAVIATARAEGAAEEKAK